MHFFRNSNNLKCLCLLYFSDLSVPSDYGTQTTSGIIELKPQGYGPPPQHTYHPHNQQFYHQVHPHSKTHHVNHLPPPAPSQPPQPLPPHQQQLHLEQQQRHKALHQQRDANLQRGNKDYDTNVIQLLDVNELQNQSSRL